MPIAKEGMKCSDSSKGIDLGMFARPEGNTEWYSETVQNYAGLCAIKARETDNCPFFMYSYVWPA